ncbi:hypothetical protein K432DRAFT_428738 [Lepidopterella palustris CBS 459.81]|uniref:Uncharacterized protein n=1 Tax=Lepidopterella palustris CBS 459.81 TaxID=1314670 RepID=A0A8E2E3A9_9PEZI|nr:hypothetical protein K432DRAFT_428738 [Lepidopterella palustris CBS 459.81]
MDPPSFKFPASPGTPLFPLSPERVNGTRPPYSGGHLPQSPSLPELSTSPFGKSSHSRNNSDACVQSMVARFNSLEIRDHKEAHRRDEIAIKRAEMAREMAEMDLKKVKEEKDEVEREGKRWREEVRKLRKDIEEGKERERKLAKRMDVVIDELNRSKETHAHAQSLYEKEVRRARKEAFKSSSALVKVQEELKATRNSLRITQSGLESERMKLVKREQEAFTAQYQLVGVQEELEKTREKVKVVEEERDSLKTTLKEEEVAKIAAEGRIALPVATHEEDEEFASPAKSPRKPRMMNMDSEDKENMVPRRGMELKALQEELAFERRLRDRAEDQIDFMKMECQFRICSCRVAELQGSSYIHDNSYAAEMERIKATVPIMTPPESDHEGDEMEGVSTTILAGEAQRPSTPQEQAHQEPEEAEPVIAFSPTTGTFRALESQPKQATSKASTPAPASQLHLSSITEAAIESSPWGPGPDNSTIRTSTTSPPAYKPAHQHVHTQSNISEEAMDEDPTPQPPPLPLEPQTPLYSPSAPATPAFLMRTVTTTTKIPLHFSPATPHNLPPTPSTIAHPPTHAPETASSQPLRSLDLNLLPIDREAALEQIRQRRGRARSIAAGQSTPRKQMLEGTVGRRDISAPVGRGTKR